MGKRKLEAENQEESKINSELGQTSSKMIKKEPLGLSSKVNESNTNSECIPKNSKITGQSYKEETKENFDPTENTQRTEFNQFFHFQSDVISGDAKVLYENDNESFDDDEVSAECVIEGNFQLRRKCLSILNDNDINDDESEDGQEKLDYTDEDKCWCNYPPQIECLRTKTCKNDEDEDESDDMKCKTTQAFVNHNVFPSFAMLQKNISTEQRSLPTKGNHWALLVDIVKTEDMPRSIIGKTKFDEEVKINFMDVRVAPITFAWSDMKVGHSLAILYVKRILDIIVVSDLDNCFIVKASLLDINNERFSILDSDDSVDNGSLFCQDCNKEIISSRYVKKPLINCQNCCVAYFCSEV